MCKHLRIFNIIPIVFLHIYSVSADTTFDAISATRFPAKRSREIMSPKMDYDEWTPLGRGDPLKNDPTFDYSPPMVSKVKYWINPLYRTPDPPIVPSKDEPTTFATASTAKPDHHHRTTTISTATVGSEAYASNEPPPSAVAASSDIKRFIIEPSVTVDATYLQMVNSKYAQKLTRLPPSLASVSNHVSLHVPTRQPASPPVPQPPAPLPMLVPPPPVEPSSYASTNVANSTAVELSWDVKTHVQPYIVKFTTTTPSIMSAAFVLPKGMQTRMTTSKSTLLNLLSKEKLPEHRFTFATATTAPPPAFTPNPLPFPVKQTAAIAKPVKASSHLIIQGHSKVKKYGGGSSTAAKMADRFDRLSSPETNEISDLKFELPKDVRDRKRLNDDDLQPLRGLFGDVFATVEDGSGLGAGEVTRPVLLPPNHKLSSKIRHQRRSEYDEQTSRANTL